MLQKHDLISETKLGAMISSDNAEIDELKERLRQLDVERTVIQERINGLEAATRAATPSTEAICTVLRSAAGVDQHWSCPSSRCSFWSPPTVVVIG